MQSLEIQGDRSWNQEEIKQGLAFLSILEPLTSIAALGRNGGWQGGIDWQSPVTGQNDWSVK
ncbi:MAG TPA: hypothetical protein V6C84_28875 [Coleofasciculaceae cyanobacterium]|jgi:hypothetical protein